MPKKTEEPTLRIRMLRNAGTAIGYVPAGAVVHAPAALARGWIKAGIAEQDKVLDSAPEMK